MVRKHDCETVTDLDLIDHTMTKFAAMLAADNPHFSRSLFLRVCNHQGRDEVA
jgi:hypothetical protein